MPYQFKIQLSDIQKPPVWRRIIVPENITFDMFHQVIQAAFGWEDYHLYRFSEKLYRSDVDYKIPDEFDFYGKAEDSRETLITKVFTAPKQQFIYLYDFGDDWKHQITLEKITEERIIWPVCIDGKGACPPEDCGGIPGYAYLLETLNDPANPDHKETRKWLGLSKGQQWDVNAFDLNAVNDRLKLVELSE